MLASAFVITKEPLKLDGLITFVMEHLHKAPSSTGAVVSFLGTVRNENKGRRVNHLEYEAYEPLAIKTFEQIAMESAAHWAETRLALHHRIGRLNIGDASVAIAAASPHRPDAFAACRYAIERVKQIAPIWKHEYFENGNVWIEGATADPDSADAINTALRIACA